MGQHLVMFESVRIGALGTTGIMGTTLSTISNIVPDSAVLVFEEQDVTDFYVEDSDYPEIQVQATAVRSIEFATYDVDNTEMIMAFGGTSSTTTIWHAPYTTTAISEKSIEMISKTYGGKKIKIEIARGTLRASAELKFARSAPGQINFKATVMKPTTTASSTYPIVRTFV